tara:strand:+ start:1998 stop:2543 length:546 start_codon:yes stop_codon:yes gene_type:complete
MRAFIAIEISNSQILKKIQKFQNELKIKAKPIRLDQIHFTLQFLGEINEDRCEQVKNILKKIKFSEFELSLKRVGTFPNFRNPRIIWIGCDEIGAKILTQIAENIGNNLIQLGFEKERKFKPHLTVFRVKNKIEDISSRMKEIDKIEFGIQTISKFKLKKSVLSPKGPEYSDLLEINADEK